MSEEKFAQEFLGEFISNKGTLINSSFLEKIRPIEPIYKHNDLEIFKEISGKRLGIAVDVGSGVGQDFSVIQVFDLDTLVQVAQYRNNKLTLSEFTIELLAVLTYLKKEKEAKEIYYTVESNSISQGVLTLLENSKNPILRDQTIEFISDSKKRDGMLTTSKTKYRGAVKFKDLLESGRMTVYSKKVLSELRFFVKTGVGFAAESGMKDDLVMAIIVLTNMLSVIADYDPAVYEKISKTGGLEIELEDEEEMPLPFIC